MRRLDRLDAARGRAARLFKIEHAAGAEIKNPASSRQRRDRADDDAAGRDQE